MKYILSTITLSLIVCLLVAMEPEYEAGYKQSDETEFLNACYFGNSDTVESLLIKNTELLKAKDKQKRTGLMFIAANANGNYMKAAKAYLEGCRFGEHFLSHEFDSSGRKQYYNAATYAEREGREDLIILFQEYGLKDQHWSK